MYRKMENEIMKEVGEGRRAGGRERGEHGAKIEYQPNRGVEPRTSSLLMKCSSQLS